MATNYNLKLNLISDDKQFSKGFRAANNQLKKHQDQVKKTGTSYASLTKSQRLANKYAKEAAVHFGKDSVQFKKAAASARSYKRELDGLNRTFDSSKMGGGMKESIVGVAMKRILPLMAIAAAGRAVAGAVSTVANFEKQIKKVAVMSGATADQLDALAMSAREVGASSIKTASEIAQLQIEMSKLGFKPEEIMEATDGITSLSIAFDKDLGETARITAETLNAFGMRATETTKLVDLMANAFSNSGLDLEKFAVMMPKVGALAANLGIPIERLVAMLSKLADSGIDASTAATSLRNMFLKLKAQGEDFDEVINRIRNSTDGAAEAMEYLDVRNVNVAITLADAVAQTKELDEQFQNATVSAKELADEMSENLIDKTAKLKSAWSELMLTLGSTKTASAAIDGLTKSLEVFAVAFGTAEERVAKFDRYLEIMSGRSSDYAEEAAKGTDDAWKRIIGGSNSEDYIAGLDSRIQKLIEEWGETGLKSTVKSIAHLQAYRDELMDNLDLGNVFSDLIVEDIVPDLEIKDKKWTKYTDQLLRDIKDDIDLKDPVVIDIEPNLIVENSGLIPALERYMDEIQFDQMNLWDTDRIDKYNQALRESNDELMKLTGAFDNVRMEQHAWNAELTNMVEGSLEDLIISLSAGVGEALATGDWNSMWEGVISDMGESLVQLGSMAIAQGVLIKAIQMGWMSPAALIAAGAAAVAIGSAMKNVSFGGGDSGMSSSSGFSSSFSAGSGYSRYAGVSGHTATGSSSRSWDGESVTFKIKGTDLVGVLDKQSKKTNSIR